MVRILEKTKLSSRLIAIAVAAICGFAFCLIGLSVYYIQLQERRIATYEAELAKADASVTELVSHMEKVAAVNKKISSRLSEDWHRLEKRNAIDVPEAEIFAANVSRSDLQLEALAIRGNAAALSNNPSEKALAFAKRLGNSSNQILQKLQQREMLLADHPMSLPVNGWVTSHYGGRFSPFKSGWSQHLGMDIAAPIGTPVQAVADGTVTIAGHTGGYGNLVEIDHGKGIRTRYGHNGDMYVTPGQMVKRGQIVSRIGMTGRTTGPHVHYEVRIGGVAVDPRRFAFDSPRGRSPNRYLQKSEGLLSFDSPIAGIAVGGDALKDDPSLGSYHLPDAVMKPAETKNVLPVATPSEPVDFMTVEEPEPKTTTQVAPAPKRLPDVSNLWFFLIVALGIGGFFLAVFWQPNGDVKA